jgi:hypothetical protein
LDDRARLVLHAILSRTANAGGVTWVSDATLAADVGLPLATFNRGLADLKTAGVLKTTTHAKGGKLPNGTTAATWRTSHVVVWTKLKRLAAADAEVLELASEAANDAAEDPSRTAPAPVQNCTSTRPELSQGSLGSTLRKNPPEGRSPSACVREGKEREEEREREASRKRDREREEREERERAETAERTRLARNEAFKQCAAMLALDETKVRQACRSLDAWLSLNGDATTAEFREMAREAGGQTPQPLAPARAVLTAVRALAQHATDTVLQGAAATLADALRAYDEREDAFWATVAKKAS